MRKLISGFLGLALVATGLMTFLVFVAPDVITIGLMMLLLPGLILLVSPTAFLYLAAFSVPWFLLQHRSVATAALAGIASVGWISLGLPVTLNAPTYSALWAAQSRDLVPPERLPASSHILIQAPQSRGSELCSDLCQKLLYNGIAREVTMLPAASGLLPRRSGTPRTFTIDRRETCPDASPLLGVRNWSSQAAGDPIKAVRVRIAAGECLVELPEQSAAPGLTIRWMKESGGGHPSSLSLSPGGADIEAIQIELGGKTVARKSAIVPRTFSLPLMLSPRPRDIGFSGWEWHRDSKRNDFDPEKFLLALVSFPLEVPAGFDKFKLRELLDSALSNPAPFGAVNVFHLLDDYYAELRDHRPRLDDAERVAKIIADPRVVQFSILPVYRFSEEDRLRLKGVILDRMVATLQMGDPLSGEKIGKWDILTALNAKLDAMPPGAFSRPDPRVEKLIATPQLRSYSARLVDRLADQGATQGPRLMEFVRSGYQPDPTAGDKQFPRGSGAALHALCRLGSKAASQLPALRAISAEKEFPIFAQESDLYRATLVALGASPDEFELPHNRQWRTDLYHQMLRRSADQGCKRD